MNVVPSGTGQLPFGAVQGVAPGGIVAYSNKSDRHFSGNRHFEDGLYTGFKWQCVEYARRWLLEKKGLVLPDVHWAAHIFSHTDIIRAVDAVKVPTVAVKNGTAARPEVDTLLIYPSTESNMVGHVAAIVEVGNGWIRTADQNHSFHKWGSHYSIQLPVVEVDGTFTIEDIDDESGKKLIPLGWMTYPGTPNRDISVPVSVHVSLKTPAFPPAELNRVSFTPTQAKENWLDLTNAAEKKFVETFGMDVSRTRLNEQQSNYYTMNLELWFKCVNAGNQLHRIFCEASAEVIASDEMMGVFGIPQEFWGRVRNSFATQKKCLTGRFDFAFDGASQKLKCFEYNADSASTLLECTVIQQKWAESVGLDGNTRSSGFRMKGLLEYAWQQSGVPKGSRVHFCVDDDDEEQYTALIVMECAKAAGLDPKLCVMFDEFKFNAVGAVVDSEGIPVRTVWKTWMWESGFTDYFKAKESRPAGWKAAPADTVRLCDILLGDETIVVFEPLWKVVPSNKAILPLIYKNHPDNEFILRAEFELSDDLRKVGYAKKPIVGRCGRNVTITSSEGEKLLASEGNFGDRDHVFQELFVLPKRDDYYAILGGWIVGDEYAGTGIREDKTIITGIESPFSALRIMIPFDPKPVTAEEAETIESKEI